MALRYGQRRPRLLAEWSIRVKKSGGREEMFDSVLATLLPLLPLVALDCVLQSEAGNVLGLLEVADSRRNLCRSPRNCRESRLLVQIPS